MDLDQFRRQYMHMDGIGNTPVRLLDRLQTFGRNVVGIASAAKKDLAEAQKRHQKRSEIMNEMREKGYTARGIFDMVRNGPIRTSTNTSKALSRTADSAISLGKSVNELGSTAASIVGTSRTNLYEGQDMEKGISFVLEAAAITKKGLKASKSVVRESGLVIEGIGLTGESLIRSLKLAERRGEIIKSKGRGGENRYHRDSYDER